MGIARAAPEVTPEEMTAYRAAARLLKEQFGATKAGRIREELLELKRVVDRAKRLMAKA